MKILTLVLLLAFVCRADDEPADEPGKPVMLEKIVVVGHNFCKPETLNKFLPNRSSSSVVLRTASDCFPDDSSCNPNYEIAYLGASFIQKASKADTWELGIYGSTCIQNCKGSEYRAGKTRVESSGQPHKAKYEFKISEIYDADGEKVEVSCPSDTCEGVFVHSEKGPYFLTDTKLIGGKVERRLIVNTKIGSKFVDKHFENKFENCDN